MTYPIPFPQTQYVRDRTKCYTDLVKKYQTIEKRIGETPREATERLRQILALETTVPLAYAGRLDPMASGKLLILIGEECKHQENYHGLDKEYRFEVLFGIRSDTGDVLGLGTTACDRGRVTEHDLVCVAEELRGNISLPYPHFSSRTVKGKPLHVWTLEGRLHEITIPMRDSHIYSLTFEELKTMPRSELFSTIREKIETPTTVTDDSKELGKNFRRDAIRARWTEVERTAEETYVLARFTAIVSSGTYIRSLSELIAEKLGTCGLAYSIHRTKIGTYVPLFKKYGFWRKTF